MRRASCEVRLAQIRTTREIVMMFSRGKMIVSLVMVENERNVGNTFDNPNQSLVEKQQTVVENEPAKQMQSEGFDNLVSNISPPVATVNNSCSQMSSSSSCTSSSSSSDDTADSLDNVTCEPKIDEVGSSSSSEDKSYSNAGKNYFYVVKQFCVLFNTMNSLKKYPRCVHYACTNARYHAFRTKLADDLRKPKYTVYEEVHRTVDNGSKRRITIRFETYKGQPEDVHEEKRAIYVPTIPYYKDKYQLHDISVTGLMFGARGTIPNFSSQFCKTLGLYKSFLNELALLIIRELVKLLRNHIYGI
ncbi:hypothetical protein ANN_09833 [Periplaneta americana]|uniref:Uncharacterized protein n=1 Tax=Periplaneta americana TaxID=6978 RepID=A0ABQ8TR11_PERAM|nr:hypothetical protein ANN_09833 [Periplaneta americana]